MRYLMVFLVIASSVLTGCSSRYSDHGSITEVSLTAPEQQTVAQDISNTLFSALGARAVLDFPHSAGNTFASTLASSLRQRGIGVNEQESQGYNTLLQYQLVSLNPQQFYVQFTAGNRQFSRIWSTQDNVLAPLASQGRGEN